MDSSRPPAASCQGSKDSFYQPLMKTLFLCNHCGILSANRQRCDRCRRQISAAAKVIEQPLFDSPHAHTKDSENHLPNSASWKHSNNKHEEIIDLETYVSPTKERQERPRKNLSEDFTRKAVARRPRKHLSEDPTRNAVAEALRKVEMQVACCKMKKRPSKRKHEENPVCLTISSDEEDNCSIIEPPEPFSKSVKGSSEVIIIEESLSVASSLNSSLEVRDGGCIDCELSTCECDMSEEEQRMCGGAPPRHPPFKQRKLNKPGCSVNCRSVRIGSCKITPDSEVVVSAEGIFLEFKLPVVLSTIEIHIPLTEVTGAQAYFGSNMPVIFISTSALCAKNIRNKLNMISSEASYFYPEGNDETQKRITMIISKIREDQIMVIKALFGDLMLERNLTDPVLDLLDMKDANDLLVRSTPPEFMNLMKIVKIGTDGIVETKLTAPPSPPPVTIPSEVAKMVIYPPPPATGGITITNEDFLCLRPGEFLNDVIIDFYLRYLLQEILGEEDRRSTHVFSTFFYKRLTQRPVRKAAILEEQNLPPAERRHNRVKTWSRHVDIFEKDFIVIPINENAHWYLAIVCYPSLAAPVYADDDSPVPPEELSDLYVPGKRAPSTTQAPPKMVCVLKDGTPIMVDAHSEDAEERDEAEPDSEEAEYVPLSQQRGNRQSESLRNGNYTGDQIQEAEHVTETDQSTIGALECETAIAQLIETQNQSEHTETNGQLGESMSENRTENGENMEEKGVESLGEGSELCEKIVNGEKEQLDESGENKEREYMEENKDGVVPKTENKEIKDNDYAVIQFRCPRFLIDLTYCISITLRFLWVLLC